jgi:hypothetical protein
VLGHVTAASDPTDVALGPDLRIRHVRLREREASAGTQERKGLPQREPDVEVVQDADAHDRIELAALEARAGLGVADHDLGAAVGAFPADPRRRLAQLQRRQLAPGRGQSGRELARARSQFQTAHAGSDSRRPDQKIGSARGANTAGRPGPAPHLLEARGDRLALQLLARVALLGTR